VQRTRDYQADGVMENSPDYLGKLRFAVPVGRKFDLGSGVRYESSARTLAAT
jgi:hypothetical protein